MGLLDKFKRTKDGRAESVPEKEMKKTAKAVKPAVKKEEVKIEEKKTASKKVVSANSAAHRLLVRPLVSEKAAIAESRGAYTFIVSAKANKTEIKKAIKDVYGANAEKVRIVNVSGKMRRFGRSSGRTSDFKKAIVYLKKGETIGVHEGV